MKKYLIIGGIVVVLVVGFILIKPEPPFKGTLIPDELKLKVAKEKVLFNKETEKENGDKMVQYYYASDEEIPTQKIEKTKDNLEKELKKQKVDYDVVYDKPQEDISQRTRRAMTFNVGKTKKGELIQTTMAYSQSMFVQKVDDGKWYLIKNDFTTKEAFDEQMKVSIKDKLFGLLHIAQANPDVFYPDANPETTTFDGYVGDNTPNESWANKIAGPAAFENDNGKTIYGFYMLTGATTNTWTLLYRTIILFDTSSLPDTATITSATITVLASPLSDQQTWGGTTSIYSSSPISNTSISWADWGTMGSTELSDTISYATFASGSSQVFTLTAAAMTSNVSLTGISKFAFRNTNYDVGAVDPGKWLSTKFHYVGFFSGDEASTSASPYLTVTYTTGGVATEDINQTLIITPDW